MTSNESQTDGDTGGQPGAGTSLTPSPDRGVDPFLPAADVGAPARGIAARLLDYSAHAAIIVGLIGFAWTVSSHLATQPTAAQIETPLKTAAVVAPPATPHVAPRTSATAPSPMASPADDMTQLRAENAKLASDIKALHASLDALRSNVRRDQTPEELRALQADLATVKTGLTSTKTETDAALAQLTGKVDRLQHEPQTKIQQLVDRLGRLEHQPVDTSTTGSIGTDETRSTLAKTTLAKAVPTPPAKPASVKLASADDESAKPQVISGWVVRDVYDGVALIEGRRGPMEVVPGVSIPGAGIVKSISRHGGGWTVTTTKGQLAYAAPPRDYRRMNDRDAYAPYPDY